MCIRDRAIVLGLIYLVATKTISIAIPASYVGSMFVFYLCLLYTSRCV